MKEIEELKLVDLYIDELKNNPLIVKLGHTSKLSYFYENKLMNKFWNEVKLTLTNYSYQFIENFDIKSKKLSNPIKINCLGMNICDDCGKKIEFTFGNHYIEDNGYDCKKINEYSFTINVPSGKLVFCDWPDVGNKRLLELENNFNNSISINYKIGRYYKSKGYAENNIIHFYVGNTCPNILQNKNKIYVECPQYDEEKDEEIIPEGFVDKGSICTDLWWVTGFDLETFKNILTENEYKEFMDMNGYTQYIFVDVEPGVYKCTYDANSEYSDNPVKYLTIEKI